MAQKAAERDATKTIKDLSMIGGLAASAGSVIATAAVVLARNKKRTKSRGYGGGYGYTSAQSRLRMIVF